jgi:hypothetical protein
MSAARRLRPAQGGRGAVPVESFVDGVGLDSFLRLAWALRDPRCRACGAPGGALHADGCTHVEALRADTEAWWAARRAR